MQAILFEQANGIATITLNRPDKFNSFTKPMAMLLQQVLDECSASETIRVVLLTGAGKAFCAGQDLAEASSDDFAGFTKVVSEHYNPIIIKMRELNKPIVVAVNGVAAGAGANIALAGDIVLAHEQASFIQAFSKIGLVPDSGGTFILPRLVGMQQATALMMLGNKVTATEAVQLGMVYKALPDADYNNTVQQIVNQLATMPTQALALTKQLLNSSATNNLAQQLQAECELQTVAGNTHDYSEGVQAFLQKRTPEFKGK
jgi:2-(1,2-epoxy-1,2-dihydrophenyl)acetyl-CoA isomerase